MKIDFILFLECVLMVSSKKQRFFDIAAENAKKSNGYYKHGAVIVHRARSYLVVLMCILRVFLPSINQKGMKDLIILFMVK
ncbi:hypothetical protein SAGO17_0022 [Mimivirus AB-566-O17]|uniref:Uncharacterized protein n=1 Tax=Mimivirus AB-566-O17 TaxID=1988039 RepID=A0A1X9VNN6_9VIRU|nr:hypothetical protein SAGO17_0022 [Mimivirus AB-566-O17]